MKKRVVHFTLSDKTECGLSWAVSWNGGLKVLLDVGDTWQDTTCKRCLKARPRNDE